MGFRFRFDRLLAYREEMEKRSLMEMTKVQMRRDQELRGLQVLKQEAQMIMGHWEGLAGQRTPMEEVRRIHTRWMSVREDVRKQERIVEEWESRLKDAREKWGEARKAKKMLQMMKQKAFEAFLQGLRKAEVKHLDEVALRPFSGHTPPMGGGDTIRRD